MTLSRDDECPVCLETFMTSTKTVFQDGRYVELAEPVEVYPFLGDCCNHTVCGVCIKQNLYTDERGSAETEIAQGKRKKSRKVNLEGNPRRRREDGDGHSAAAHPRFPLLEDSGTASGTYDMFSIHMDRGGVWMSR
mmetsp:Transcript_49093/g.96809  ORF Transcript_49093/g.96809 Transcript_49093/m.96809 type:complete len:136 (-) Transcript_49093:294-701(-)